MKRHMKRHMKRIILFTISIVSTFFGNRVPAAPAGPSPEKESIFLAKHLKPILDEDWKNIAGPRIVEKYSIVQGDTLFDISKRLFGDAKYWPKIWAINN